MDLIGRTVNASTHEIFYPLVGLTLWINEQGPSPGILDYHTIFHWQGVPGETSDLPVAYLNRVPQRGYQRARVWVRNLQSAQMCQPVVNYGGAILSLGGWTEPSLCHITKGSKVNKFGRVFLALLRNRNSWTDPNNPSFSGLSWLQACQNQLTVSLWRFYSQSGMRVAREWTIVWLILTILIPE